MTISRKHRPQIERSRLLRQWLTWKALRLSRRKGDVEMVAITGDHIADHIRAFGLYEREQLENLRDWILPAGYGQGRVALDIGANIGNHAIFLSRLFDKVIAFEPNPLARVVCSLNLDLNQIDNVELHSVGLGQSKSSANVVSRGGNLGATHLEPEEGTTGSVAIVAGDELLGSMDNIGFVKIDIEGGEAAALAGLAQTLQKNRPIIMMEQLADSASKGAASAFELLLGTGYRAFEMRRSPKSGLLAMFFALVTGRQRYTLARVENLDPRDYPVLIFMPQGDG